MLAQKTRTGGGPLSRPARPSPFELVWGRWGSFLVAASVTALFVYYLVCVAPSLVPVPPSLKVPYPEATRFLEGVSTWCGGHPVAVAVMGLVSLVLGFILPINGARYHFWLAAIVCAALAFTYMSISAPIDRLYHRVKDSLPEGREVPDPLPRGVRSSR